MSATLTEAEVASLCMELEHSPSCEWANGSRFAFVDEDGSRWEDHWRTVPYREPECTCGYFALMERSRVKLRAIFDAPAPEER